MYIYIYFFFDLWAFCSKNKYSMKGELPKSLFVNTYIRFQIFSRFSDCFITIHRRSKVNNYYYFVLRLLKCKIVVPETLD